MKHISELKPAAARPRPNAKVLTNAMPRISQPARKYEPFGFPRPQARNAQNARNKRRDISVRTGIKSRRWPAIVWRAELLETAGLTS